MSNLFCTFFSKYLTTYACLNLGVDLIAYHVLAATVIKKSNKCTSVEEIMQVIFRNALEIMLENNK